MQSTADLVGAAAPTRRTRWQQSARASLVGWAERVEDRFLERFWYRRS